MSYYSLSSTQSRPRPIHPHGAWRYIPIKSYLRITTLLVNNQLFTIANAKIVNHTAAFAVHYQ